MKLDPVQLAQKLISFPSITPVDAGAIDYLIEVLSGLGFKCQKVIFDDVTNLYARYGNLEPNFCFAGHTDVVPTGDINSWSFDPFLGDVHDQKLYGRGAVDMKGAIACFIASVSEFIHDNPNFNGSISFLITGDEEGPAINGTIKMLDYLKDRQEKISLCLVGEPTSSEKLGDIIKIGRRGSICADIIVRGIQGHVAYPHLANNPVTGLVSILGLLKNTKLDDGNEEFQASNLEITNIEVGNNATNVIPASASASFNIRFNNIYNLQTIEKWIRDVCDNVPDIKYDLIIKNTAESFLTSDLTFGKIIQDAVFDTMGISAKFSTDGGTSDARFIKNYCPVIEFGLTNATAHKIDEHVSLEDIANLSKVYLNILKKYFV
ncbi:Succinyl-diaminopimelate desuccinylase [Candidatus Arcanobacter lacustris]|uniref:Succinyl-diaminopimelate desuccinylase n=1 Tax=Candidatus Arcanibacter lacustris TaxID=1607817 RepID=A0A0F5MNA7_9RICK|nr:Succinyl-diaminopimelate desuccinylase [Candidatus Arcanobacter lacustris]